MCDDVAKLQTGGDCVWCVYVLGVNCGGAEFCMDRSYDDEGEWMGEMIMGEMTYERFMDTFSQ